jgi:hypothetical protein
MTYKILINSEGIPSGYLFDDSGEYTEQQAKNAILCGKTNPTEQEINQAIEANALMQVASEYKRLRGTEYPPITDYLDGVVKGDQEQIQAYIDACLAVKAKYPKPEGN